MNKIVVNGLAIIGGLTVTGLVITAIAAKKVAAGLKEAMGSEDIKGMMNDIKEGYKEHQAVNEYAEENNIKVAVSEDGTIVFIKDNELERTFEDMKKAYEFITKM